MDNEMKKPRLEELYQGVPDESVNLTFQDLVNVNNNIASSKRNTSIEPFSETSPIISKNPTKVPSSPSLTPLSIVPSHNLHDINHNHHHHQDHFGHSSTWGGNFGHRVEGDHRGHDGNFSYASRGGQSPRSRVSEYSMSYDGVSLASGRGGGGGGGRRRRPGIPHSKICTICSNYVYFFRTRCLVCGRVYCKQCVEMGMGDMTEGRKCVECLGLRFSQRYIERAGMVGCCSWRYPSTLKQAELKWAEKGPRRSGDRGFSSHHHGMTSSTRPKSPLSIATNEPSFVMSATYSPFSSHHHIPL